MTPSRRDVLKAAGLAASAASAAGLLGACSKGEDIQSGPATVKKTDIPVGGGKVLDNTYYVVTQPTAGTFVAFSRVCPHAGCNVSQVDGADIVCPCHGSKFSIKDGSVVHGPATSGLSKTTCKVSGSTITVGA